MKCNQLKDVVDKLNKITPYKTVKKGIPPIRKPFPIDPTFTDIIRSDEMINTQCRMDSKYEDVLSSNQNIGSFAGFQALMTNTVMKSKPYYWLTFPKPPHKSVLHEVMMRLLDVS